MTNTEEEIKPIKLTKSALGKFIRWTKTKYNDWLGYGTKKQNVDKVFKAKKITKALHLSAARWKLQR